MTELTDMLGKHMLDAVDFSKESRKRWTDEYEDCAVCRFRLNGTVYAAVEDPSDGYRSCMQELIVDDLAEMQNVFPPIEVVGTHKTSGSFGDKDDILQLIDTTTGKAVLEVGTASTDDYYPSFVSHFDPAAMATNA
ncbi:MAG: hypothetical protein CL535_16500 [Ahrensia sp.]|nr:hypothetical protein [Ahrensia sp.]MBV48174.1 hypothetical protein [Roseobacter sp.]MBV48275.1 hypothetical protein [Roseobacter sp.]|tara:strand:- start:143224 stop:143631 length:408 start_codon:yes stop_codon:yes gene_type:complete